MMNHNNYHFVGMHFIWWSIWVIFLIWIFISPFNIPGQLAKRKSPLDVLKMRLAAGEINKEEFLEKKKMLELK
jgi:putative membrane protein